MQIQDLSYTLNNDKLDFKDYQISIEVFSLENVYTIEPQTLLKKEIIIILIIYCGGIVNRS